MKAIRNTLSTEDSLLAAARESILAVGWSRTTLTDVAKRGGVSRMTIYRRWPDKDALLGDLLTSEWSRLMSTLLSSAPKDDPRARLAHLVREMTKAVREDPLFHRILDVDPELLLPYLLDRPGRSQEMMLEVLVAEIRAGQGLGAVRLGNAHLLARTLVLAAHGFVLSASTMVAPRKASQRGLDEELSELVERYLTP